MVLVSIISEIHSKHLTPTRNLTLNSYQLSVQSVVVVYASWVGWKLAGADSCWTLQPV